MSLKAKLRAAVNKAFSAVGDLVVTATLSTKSVTGYDFSGRTIISTEGSTTVDVILQSTQKPSGDGFTTVALMKSGPDLSVYDTLSVDSIIYNIVDYTDDGFVITAIVVREK